MQRMRVRLWAITAGMVATIATASMLGLHPIQSAAATIASDSDGSRKIKEAEDQLADAERQVWFWQQELINADAEVTRLHAENSTDPRAQYFLLRSEGLATRAANSHVDARLLLALCQRRLVAIKGGVQ